MTKTTTGAHRAISHSSWQTTTPKIVKTKHDEITMRDFTTIFPPFSISIHKASKFLNLLLSCLMLFVSCLVASLKANVPQEIPVLTLLKC